MIREQERAALSGLPMLVLLPLLVLGSGYWLIVGALAEDLGQVIEGGLVLLVASVALFGFFVVNPNEGKVLQLFGAYRGTVKIAGLRWANPFYSARRVSLRVRNFETGKLKVNDARGNPIEIGAAALRNMATGYPYDAHGVEEVDLVSHTAEISLKLRGEIQERLERAGVEVIEARISHLAYAPEIASAMLRRQQAAAVIAARQKIVEGAVGMVQMALEMLSQQGILELDEERKAAMVSNLLVVLCSEQQTQPVVNTGTLHN